MKDPLTDICLLCIFHMIMIGEKKRNTQKVPLFLHEVIIDSNPSLFEFH